jgi:hypothetical protein
MRNDQLVFERREERIARASPTSSRFEGGQPGAVLCRRLRLAPLIELVANGDPTDDAKLGCEATR